MRKFGLIGYPLTHSFSQKYFTDKFLRESVGDCSYSNFPLAAVGELEGILRDPELCGLNVTIPYKEQVIPFLDVRDQVVEEIGACNCIRIRDGKLTGYNTDVVGFERSMIPKLEPRHTHALILGTGGAAKAVEYVIKKLGLHYRYVSRKPRAGSEDLGYEQIDPSLLGTYTLIINTSPLGMHPNVDECPLIPYGALTPRHYLYDLVYNPAKTLFLRNGEAAGAVVENGHEMLIIQAEESWRIWNS